MADNLPRRLRRGALDRGLARAAELQSSFAEAAEWSGMLSEDQIIELGKEAGLSPEHLGQGMGEERTRGAPPEERGLSAMILGPAHVGASRVVPGSATEILNAIDDWMQRQEILQIKRRVGDRIVWEPRRDLAGTLTKAFNFAGRGYHLSRAGEVSATATAIDATRCIVALDASLVARRGALAVTAASVSGLGIGASVIVGLLSPFVSLAVIPVDRKSPRLNSSH